MVFLVTGSGATLSEGVPDFYVHSQQIQSLGKKDVRDDLLALAGKDSVIVGTLGIKVKAGEYEKPAIPDENLYTSVLRKGEVVFYDVVPK